MDNKRIPFLVRLHKDSRELLAKAAQDQRRSVSSIIDQCVRDQLQTKYGELNPRLQNNTPQVVSYASGSKRMVSVRRLMRELITGQAQPDGHYGHTCGNHACVNPDHTIWRGERAHLKHMAKKRKVTTVTASKLRKYRIETGQAKLSESKAQAIRLSDEPGPVLAERYGVSRSWINRIKRGEVWRVLSSPFAGLFK